MLFYIGFPGGPTNINTYGTCPVLEAYNLIQPKFEKAYLPQVLV